MDAPQNNKFIARLKEEGPVLCAQGYIFALERRGYLQVGPFVPEVVLEHPESVEELTRNFVHAGSDVVEALTYYAQREKMRQAGAENKTKELNKKALEIAKKVASEDERLLVAGNICNTYLFEEPGKASLQGVKCMFEEQVGWAKEAGVDFIIAETYETLEEALIATDVITKAGLPSVVTLAAYGASTTIDGVSYPEAMQRLSAAGATVVGLNCARGPETMLPILADIRKSYKGPLAALPVPYRTTEERPTFQSLCGREDMYVGLEPYLCTRAEVASFARQCMQLDPPIDYIGLCCGADPYHIRAVAEAIGRTPPASAYSADMTQLHWAGKAYAESTYAPRARAPKPTVALEPLDPKREEAKDPGAGPSKSLGPQLTEPHATVQGDGLDCCPGHGSGDSSEGLAAVAECTEDRELTQRMRRMWQERQAQCP